MLFPTNDINPLEVIGISRRKLRELGLFKSFEYVQVLSKSLMGMLHPDRIHGDDEQSIKKRSERHNAYTEIGAAREALDSLGKFKTWYYQFIEDKSVPERSELKKEMQDSIQAQETTVKNLLEYALSSHCMPPFFRGAPLAEIKIFSPEICKLTMLLIPIKTTVVKDTPALMTTDKSTSPSSKSIGKKPYEKHVDPVYRSKLVKFDESGYLIEGYVDSTSRVHFAEKPGQKRILGFLKLLEIKQKYTVSSEHFRISGYQEDSLLRFYSDIGLGAFIENTVTFSFNDKSSNISIADFSKIAQFLSSRPNAYGNNSDFDMLVAFRIIEGKMVFSLEGFVTDIWYEQKRILRGLKQNIRLLFENIRQKKAEEQQD